MAGLRSLRIAYRVDQLNQVLADEHKALDFSDGVVPVIKHLIIHSAHCEGYKSSWEILFR